jgi:hypothetical protein
MKPRELSREIDASGNVAVAEIDGQTRIFNVYSGAELSRAQLNYSFGGRRLWSGSLAGDDVTFSCSWDGGVSCYASNDLPTCRWERRDLRHGQYLVGTPAGMAVSTNEGGIWLLDPNGRTVARRPELDEMICCAGDYGVAATRGQLFVVNPGDLANISSSRVTAAPIVSADAIFDQFVVGSIDGLIAAFTPACEPVFRVQLRPRELALRLVMRSRRDCVALVKNVSTVQYRLATFNEKGAEIVSAAIDPVLDAAALRGGAMFAVIRTASNKLTFLSSDDGQTLRSIDL